MSNEVKTYVVKKVTEKLKKKTAKGKRMNMGAIYEKYNKKAEKNLV